MKKNKCLICVDVQNDFCPGGSLAIPEGDTIIPTINKLLSQFDFVIFTKDWHDPEMNAFASQHDGTLPFDVYENAQGKKDTLWPDHCIANTPGADFHPDLDLSKCKKDFYIFKKGSKKDHHPYSGFEGTELKKFLKKRGVDEVHIVGLALDYCVKDTAIDAAMAGFKTVVIEDACMPIDPNINQVLKDFKDAGVAFIESWEIPMYNLL